MAQITPQQMQRLLAAFREDIPFFAKHIFGSELRPKQVEFVEKFRDNELITFKGGVGFGKSHALAILVWWSLFVHNEVKVSIFGPSEIQIDTGIWNEVGILHERMPSDFKNEFVYAATTAYRKGAPNSVFAITRTANKDNVTRARGIHIANNFVFVDEASGVPDEIFDVLINAQTDKNPKLCIISNPDRTSGTFYESWEHPEKSKLWTHIHGQMTDNPDLDAKRLERMIVQYGGVGSRNYRIMVLGEFPLDEVDGVISREAVIAAIDNEDAIPPHDAAVIWGLDPNGGGKDRSVLVKRQDNVVLEMPKAFNDLDAVQLAQAVYDEFYATPQRLRPADICVDANGPGYGVYTMLLNMNLPVKKVMVQNSPTRDPQIYSRLRDQLWWSARQWFLDGGVSIPNDPEFHKELCFPTFEYEGNGKIKVEDKKSIRKRGRKSPDIADAFCLTFASNKTNRAMVNAWSKPLEYDVRHYE